ncbi:MAG: hypothetical protein ABJA67_05285, partial [Chthonomonadales bacterium]
MPFNYIANFPIPEGVLPIQLRMLLEPVGNSPQQQVEVTSRYDFDRHGPNREYVHMIMAVVADDGPVVTPSLKESGHGVVSYSVPFADEKGSSKNYVPSISGNDYIVASWGNGSFYTYNLSEKVWMALGLSPRCVGNDNQRIVYDDLSLPEFGVAEGEVSTEFYWSPKRDVSWKMSNEYLRKYLWMRSAWGVRVFFYEKLLPDTPQLRNLMNGQVHVLLKQQNCWYELDIREHGDKLLIQVWATVKSVSPELCQEQSANGIAWPDVDGLMTHDRADALLDITPVFLDDKFLQRYEQNDFYEATPVNVHGAWKCSPQYRGQWGFTGCERIGRNLIRVPMRELYKPKPDREILHAHTFAKAAVDISHIDLQEEHIVAKTQRLLDQLLILGDTLSALAACVGIHKPALELVDLSRIELHANGWAAYPRLSRLAQVAPLEMSQQAFLSRCKSLHEIWQRVPSGFLKSLLEKAGCPRASVKELGSLRLLQGLLNIATHLNVNEESSDAFQNDTEPERWNEKNASMASLFLNNDLRIADAHETVEECLVTLQNLGFDIANINQGYGRALDFV